MKKCAYCEKEFNTNTNLKRHEITHTGEQPFQVQEYFKFFHQLETTDYYSVRSVINASIARATCRCIMRRILKRSQRRNRSIAYVAKSTRPSKLMLTRLLTITKKGFLRAARGALCQGETGWTCQFTRDARCARLCLFGQLSPFTVDGADQGKTSLEIKTYLFIFVLTIVFGRLVTCLPQFGHSVLVRGWRRLQTQLIAPRVHVDAVFKQRLIWPDADELFMFFEHNY